MSKIIEQIKETIKKYELIDNNDNIVVGFSGGPDSLCLLHSLYSIKEEFGIDRIAAVHINHMYRGEDAFKDESFAEEFCRERGILFFSYRYDIDKLAAELRMSSEEAGRKMRYEAFREVVSSLGGGKIAVAHNKEDQAETLLMRLVRGTGTDGLAGIEYKRDGIIRPLLACSRKDIEDYCKENLLNPRIDRTNLEPIYTRNVVRLKLIPYINEIMGGDAVNSLAGLSDIVKEDKSFIYEYVDSAIKKYRIDSDLWGDNKILMDRVGLKTLHPAVRKRLLMRCFSMIGLHQDITSVHLRDAERLILSDKTTGNAEFPHEYVLKCRYDRIVFEKIHENDTIEYELICKIIEEESEVAKLKQERISKHNQSKQIFDYDKVKEGGNPVLRTRRAGDVISPKGFRGTKRLKEYFIDKKIDRDLRDSIPLFCLGGVVLWIYGYEVNDRFLVDEETTRLLEVRIIEKKSQQ